MDYVKPFLLAAIACISGGIVLNPDVVKLFVGQPFQYAFQTSSRAFEVRDASGEELPTWLIWNSNERLLEGVPQPADIGKTFLRLTNDLGNDVMEISVNDEIKDPCGVERSTFWMEIAFNTSLSNLSISDKLHLINTVADYFNVNNAALRVYTHKYADEIRRTEVVESGMQHEPNDDSTTILWKLSCDEVDEEAIDVLEKMLSFDESDALSELKQKLIGWKLTKGTFLPRKQRNHGTGSAIVSQWSGFATNEPYIHVKTTSLRTTTRSTRATKRVDKPPVRLNSLQAFTCKRGILCEYVIPKETFMDVEDGNTRSLSLSVFPILPDRNWLTLDRSKQILRGISLDKGDFEFRLEARDSSNQMTSAPFRVTVVDPAPVNHLFTLDVQHSYERLTKDPDTLNAFAEKLANSLGDRFPQHLVIRNIEAAESGGVRSLVSFSNSTLLHKFCQRKAIDAIKHMMLTKKRDRIRADFVRSMDSRFRVRNAKLELLGSCAEESSTSLLPTGILFTTPVPPGHDTYSSTDLWLPVAIAAFLLFFLVVLVVTCCLVKRTKTKAVQTEYISKGLPVVFPEEIPQDDESATVSTPMLVKEERPPLIISQHENPLYKPPPPLFAASSPRPRNAITNQRQPPPYIPP